MSVIDFLIEIPGYFFSLKGMPCLFALFFIIFSSCFYFSRKSDEIPNNFKFSLLFALVIIAGLYTYIIGFSFLCAIFYVIAALLSDWSRQDCLRFGVICCLITWIFTPLMMLVSAKLYERTTVI